MRSFFMRRTRISAFALALAAALVASVAYAHQPWFEDSDFTVAAPFQVADATISTAVYATLATARDVDFYRFSGNAGDAILLEMTIPQIEGQENFAPTMALLGSGLGTLPAGSRLPASIPSAMRKNGALLLPAPAEASTFYEPYSRTSYWERQSQWVTLPATGDYIVAIWNPARAAGRYTFVIGSREVWGGDPDFGRKMRDFWTPVPTPTPRPGS